MYIYEYKKLFKIKTYYTYTGKELIFTGAWPVDTKEALKCSIAKWDFLSTYAVDYEGGTSTCALCKLFVYQNCMGCPVRSYTGKVSCFDTPYWEHNRNPTVRNARKELKFLRMLLKQYVSRETS